MAHLESVEVLSGTRSRWRVKAPGGLHVSWEAEIVNEQPNALLAWQSLSGADVAHWGQVRFRPVDGDSRTEVAVELEYAPTAGVLGAVIAKLFGEEPTQQLQDDLRRLKRALEAPQEAAAPAS
jgi:uncharacterized membrane protein